MGQQQTMTVAAEEKGGVALLLRRMILVLALAALMAAMTVATAIPAFAKSFASNAGRGEQNFGHCKSSGIGGIEGGPITSEANPSFQGGKDKTLDIGVLCGKV